ncbi:MAG: aminomethyl-transferring glycine dehydrogenase subunit GcvPA [Trueperaceae bacterium]|nr:MAG: aminomethyl-transferring glycine dehydrogenase subunit GcvPA [Trueperaceae bacterium]
MNYLPHTPEDILQALQAIGVSSPEDLFDTVPSVLRDHSFDLPEGMDETSLLGHLEELAAKNKSGGPNFLGGGVRRHFIPSVTPHLAFQSEFVTSYTPYQPEVSQGILQATFEFQTMMSELTGLPISNASMYDGATAVAEAALLALRHTRRSNVIVSEGVHPEAREVLRTYVQPLGATIRTLKLAELTTPTPVVDDSVACVIAQHPNFLGYLEAMPELCSEAHAAGALFIAVVDPLSLALLKTPGSYGADIAVGDGQVLGNPPNLGGPSFGFMVVDTPLLRQLPGRLVGQTTDVEGQRAFVLTLQAREQHIRRSKAKSNICSNHQLAALMATVNMAALGPIGLTDLASGSVRNAHKLAEALADTGIDVLSGRPFFNEFVVKTSGTAGEFRKAMLRHGIQAGVPVPESYGLGNAVTLTATELTTAADIEALVDAVKELEVERD